MLSVLLLFFFLLLAVLRTWPLAFSFSKVLADVKYLLFPLVGFWKFWLM